jgi:GxxExxY protein
MLQKEAVVPEMINYLKNEGVIKNEKNKESTNYTNGHELRGKRLDILYRDESYKIIGAAMAVHQEMGCGFLEGVYQEALEKEFCLQCIPYKREVPLPVYYKGELLSKNYVADFVCYDAIIVELKAVSSLSSEHKAQVLNYLKAANFKLGLLVNFGEGSLKYERLVK